MIADTLTAELDAIEARLHRACLTVACLPADGPKGFYSLWPRYRLTWWDRGNEDSKLSAADITRRFIAPPGFAPTPREVDDCLPALALLERVAWLNWRVVNVRAHQLWYGEHAGADEEFAHWRGGWRMIGAQCGVSKDKAIRAHWQAIRHAFEALHNRAR